MVVEVATVIAIFFLLALVLWVLLRSKSKHWMRLVAGICGHMSAALGIELLAPRTTSGNTKHWANARFVCATQRTFLAAVAVGETHVRELWSGGLTLHDPTPYSDHHETRKPNERNGQKPESDHSNYAICPIWITCQLLFQTLAWFREDSLPGGKEAGHIGGGKRHGIDLGQTNAPVAAADSPKHGGNDSSAS
jgi:hypothetical protein